MLIACINNRKLLIEVLFCFSRQTKVVERDIKLMVIEAVLKVYEKNNSNATPKNAMTRVISNAD